MKEFLPTFPELEIYLFRISYSFIMWVSRASKPYIGGLDIFKLRTICSILPKTVKLKFGVIKTFLNQNPNSTS